MLGDLAVIGFGALIAWLTGRLWDRGRRKLAPRAVGGLFGGLMLASGIVVGSVGGAAEIDAWVLAVAVALPVAALTVRAIVDFERTIAARRREQDGPP